MQQYVFQLPTLRKLNAVFTRGTEEEKKLCHPNLAWLKNYAGVCNLTKENGGIPWYCGKPQNLRCDDWTSVGYARMDDLPVSHVEKQLFQ